MPSPETFTVLNTRNFEKRQGRRLRQLLIDRAGQAKVMRDVTRALAQDGTVLLGAHASRLSVKGVKNHAHGSSNTPTVVYDVQSDEGVRIIIATVLVAIKKYPTVKGATLSRINDTIEVRYVKYLHSDALEALWRARHQNDHSDLLLNESNFEEFSTGFRKIVDEDTARAESFERRSGEETLTLSPEGEILARRPRTDAA